MTSDEGLRLAQSRSQARFLWFDEQHVPGTGFGTPSLEIELSVLAAGGSTIFHERTGEIPPVHPDHRHHQPIRARRIPICRRTVTLDRPPLRPHARSDRVRGEGATVP